MPKLERVNSLDSDATDYLRLPLFTRTGRAGSMAFLNPVANKNGLRTLEIHKCSLMIIGAISKKCGFRLLHFESYLVVPLVVSGCKLELSEGITSHWQASRQGKALALFWPVGPTSVS